MDVQQEAVVTFDSYPKDQQGIKRESGYGKLDFQKNNNNKQHYKYVISYDNGIISDYAIASGSVPINYAYTKIDDVKINSLVVVEKATIWTLHRKSIITDTILL